MPPSETPSKRVPNSAFPRRIALYENDAGVSLLRKLTERRGLSDTALLRALIREESARQGITPDETE